MIMDRVVVAADGTTVYVTIDGDMIDAIAYGYYGNEHKKHTEAVLGVNPGLAERGPTLPAGVVIRLPPRVEEPTVTPFRRLWD